MSLKDEAYKLSPSFWVEDLGLIRDKYEEPVVLDDLQRKILDSNHKRLIVCSHRQWGKSTLASLLVFHHALYNKRSLSLLIAPSLRQSGENFRKIIDTLGDIHPTPELEEDTKLTLKLANKSRIISLPGSQKTIRGFSAPDLIVIDEAAQASDELFSALYPMLLRNPEGQMILSSTPHGRRGFFFEIWTDPKNTGIWQKIGIKASENPRLDPEVLAEFKLQLDEFDYKQEMELEFLEGEGCLFSEALIEKMFSRKSQGAWNVEVFH